ncbi:hypothetical protein BKA70DRAFT_1259693 [Coprinopsis sp. MPI-PUGE-AT-0042]|nr:hypothetical protein BKA70DRAFT_1259693 [Coprinopsis sp. MPI-PUGE-AT-0042]
MPKHSQLPSCEPTLAQKTLVTSLVASLEGIIQQLSLFEEENSGLLQDARIISLVDTISERVGLTPPVESVVHSTSLKKHLRIFDHSEGHRGEDEESECMVVGANEADGFSRPCYAESLPTEVLLQVFDRLLPPRCLLDHTGVYTETSPLTMAKNQKKILMRVCRSWHQIIKPLLYENVVIRRHPQLFLLLESVQRTPSNAPLVRGLHIACCIQEPWAGAFSKALQRTLDCLNALISFTLYAPSTKLPPSFTLPHFPHGLSTLRLEPYDVQSRTNALDLAVALRLDLSIFASLRELSLYSLSADTSFATGSEPFMDLQLPSLEEITLIPMCPQWLSCISTWYMPNLRRATLNAVRSITTAFLERHGKTLKELQLIPKGCNVWRYNTPSEGTKELSLQSLCPRLVHLVASADFLIPWALQHDRVQWVDLWAPVDLSPLPRWLNPNEWPSLRQVRVLSKALVHLDALPFGLPPSSVMDASAVLFFNLRLRRDTGYVSIAECPLLESFFEGDSDDDSFTDYDNRDDSGSDWDGSDYGEPETLKMGLEGDDATFTLRLSQASSNDLPQDVNIRLESNHMCTLVED